MQGQALSQLNVIPQGSNSNNGEGQGQSLPDVQSQLNGLGLGGITGLASGALPSLGGPQGQLSGLGLSNAGVVGNGQNTPQVDASILANILSTPGGLAALNNLTPSQLSSLGLGGLANTASAPLSAANGLQGQLQGLGLGGATGAVTGLAGNLPLGGIANGLAGDPSSALHLPQNALGTLSDPQAVQKLLLSQAQEIAQLEKLVQEQNQKLAFTASGAGVPVSWPNVSADQARAALANSGLGDTAQVPGVFDNSLYNNKMAMPHNKSANDSGRGGNGGNGSSAAAPVPTPEVPATTAVPMDAESTVVSVWDSTASTFVAATKTASPVLGPLETFDPNGKAFVNVNPGRTAAVTNFVQTTSGWPWPMDASNLPPPVPAFTSWGVKMGQANASAKMQEIAASLSNNLISGTPTISQVASMTAEPTTTTPDRAPMPSPTGQSTAPKEEGNDMRKRSKNSANDHGADDISGSQDQTGTALNPMVPDVNSYLHDYVSSYEAPDSPASFHSAYSNPATHSATSATAVPSASGGVEGPQVVLGDERLQTPARQQSKRGNEASQVDGAEESTGADNAPESGHYKRQDEEPEPEVDPAEDNSENDPPAPAEAEAAPEPEEDPVTVSNLPDTPVPLPKTLPAQPALHSKAHRVHKKDQSHDRESHEERHHNSMAYSATSPGGRPAMRRQQAYSPEHREHHKGKDTHIHVHVNGHTQGRHYRRDEGHGDEGEPELPVAPVADPAGASQGGDAKKTADYAGSHAQMSPDCWEAMAAGKHMEHTQKRPGKLRRRNAMPDLANAASGKL